MCLKQFPHIQKKYKFLFLLIILLIKLFNRVMIDYLLHLKQLKLTLNLIHYSKLAQQQILKQLHLQQKHHHQQHHHQQHQQLLKQLIQLKIIIVL